MVVHAGHRHAARRGPSRPACRAGPGRRCRAPRSRSARRSSRIAFAGAIDAGQVLEEEREPGRGRRGVGDDGVDALRPEQVRQPGLAAEPIAVRIDVGGQADPLARHERRGQGPRRGDPIGGEGERHGENLTGAGGQAGRAGGRSGGRTSGSRARSSPGRRHPSVAKGHALRHAPSATLGRRASAELANLRTDRPTARPTPPSLLLQHAVLAAVAEVDHEADQRARPRAAARYRPAAWP